MLVGIAGCWGREEDEWVEDDVGKGGLDLISVGGMI